MGTATWSEKLGPLWAPPGLWERHLVPSRRLFVSISANAPRLWFCISCSHRCRDARFPFCCGFINDDSVAALNTAAAVPLLLRLAAQVLSGAALEQAFTSKKHFGCVRFLPRFKALRVFYPGFGSLLTINTLNSSQFAG